MFSVLGHVEGDSLIVARKGVRIFCLRWCVMNDGKEIYNDVSDVSDVFDGVVLGMSAWVQGCIQRGK